MDWNRVLPAAKAAGARWFIVEQDESETDSMESAAANAAFMAACNQE
jgi:sugar phosphate isomerase/epimerase